MQVKVHKYLFAGTRNTHDRFFEKAQKLGLMEFITESGKKPHLYPKDVQRAKEAVKILAKHERGAQEKESRPSVSEIIKDVLSNRGQLDALLERRRLLKLEFIRAKPFGSFSMDLIHKVEEEGNREIGFFAIRKDKLLENEVPKNLIFITQEEGIDYYLHVGKEKFKHKAFISVQIDRSMDAILLEMEDIEVEIKEYEHIEMESCCYAGLIEDFIFARMNSINLNFAKEDVDYIVEDKLYMIEAWIPKNRLKDIEKLIDGLPILSEEVAIEKDDKPPTCLKNTGFSKLGEDLVYVYDTPAIDDKDPSAWVIWFFALFFGIIISDAGYGFLFLCCSLFGWYKYGKTLKGSKRRFLKLFTVISCSTIAWGILVASYFSIPMQPGNVLNKISIPYNLALKKVAYHKDAETDIHKEWVEKYPSIDNVNVPFDMLDKGVTRKGDRVVYNFMSDLYDSIFLELSLVIGIFHLALSFARNLYRNWSGVGWIAALIGGYLFIPQMLDSHSMVIYTGLISRDYSFVVGEYMLYGGIGLAVLLTMIQARSLSGLFALTKVIEIFSDVLSYLRLYALGLASMVLAGTFNDMAVDAGWTFGWFILLFGHTINILLGVMAGVIHGLRLNFLEWYHHCYEGEGKKFSPLRLLKSE